MTPAAGEAPARRSTPDSRYVFTDAYASGDGTRVVLDHAYGIGDVLGASPNQVAHSITNESFAGSAIA